MQVTYRDLLDRAQASGASTMDVKLQIWDN